MLLLPKSYNKKSFYIIKFIKKNLPPQYEINMANLQKMKLKMG